MTGGDTDDDDVSDADFVNVDELVDDSCNLRGFMLAGWIVWPQFRPNRRSLSIDKFRRESVYEIGPIC